MVLSFALKMDVRTLSACANLELAWRRLIEAADAALYRAKSDGRNCVRSGQGGFPPLAPGLPDGPEMGAPVRKSASF
mgnify:CR=1 FL=1